ncbi:MAG: putative ABC transporter ATP-binding protein YxlF [Myxococcota bacterium]|nr:putative ABC transporter ATP-binding protein YxlF [Myxococcota bacterium]
MPGSDNQFSAGSAAPVMSVINAVKVFQGGGGVNGVSLDLLPGRVHGLLGPNGAGKTTLIRLMLGLLRPDSGELRFNGRPMMAADRRLIGYLPEERGLYQQEPVIDLIRYFGTLRGLSRLEAEAETAEIIGAERLAEWSKRKVKELSKGMQQKLQLAAAALGRPAVMILDEPFTGLDPINREEVIGHIRLLAEHGTAVLISTHTLAVAQEFCPEVTLIHRGHRLYSGPVDALRRNHRGERYWLDAEKLPDGTPSISFMEGVNGRRLVALRDGKSVNDLLRELIEAGAVVHAVSPALPSLEEVFIESVRAAELPMPGQGWAGLSTPGEFES